MRVAPPLDWVPQELQGSAVIIVIPSYSGDLERESRSSRRCAGR